MLTALRKWLGIRTSPRVVSPLQAFRPVRHVAAAPRDGRIVLLDLRGRSHYWGLDEMGSSVWAMILAGRTVGEMAEALAEEYDAPVSRIEADVLSFVHALLNRKLVEAA